MKAIRQLALIMAMLLPLITPAMACVLPGAHLTSRERACCKQMGDLCGAAQMPAADGCCHTQALAANQWNAAQLPPVRAFAGLNPAADLPFIAFLQISSVLRGNLPQHSLTFPQSPPTVISALRI